jgi:hypothetical protein
VKEAILDSNELMSAVHPCCDDRFSEPLLFGALVLFRFAARSHAGHCGHHLGDAIQVACATAAFLVFLAAAARTSQELLAASTAPRRPPLVVAGVARDA